MKRIHLPLRLILFMLLLTLMSTGSTLARYQTVFTGQGSLTVAKPVVEYIPGTDKTMLTGLKPGSRVEYPFSVSGAGNEVSMEYQIEVLPAAAAVPVLSYSIVPQGDYILREGWYEMGLHNETHQFVLEIVWPAGQTQAEFMHAVQEVNIVLNAQQISP